MNLDKRILTGGGLVAAAVFWVFVKPNYLDTQLAVPPTTAEIAAAVKPSYVLGEHEPVFVTLAGGSREQHYAKLQLALEMTDDGGAYVGLDAAEVDLRNEELHAEFDQRLPLIMDAVITVMGQRSVAEVLDVERRGLLKDELTAAINWNLKEDTVASLAFVMLVVQ